MKKMKKAISVILTAAMIMSMGVTAFADTTTGDDTQSTVITTTTISDYKSAVIDNEAPINFTFTKTYKTSEGTTPAKYPAETLKFNVTKAANNTNPDDTMITIADQTVDANPDDILVTVPVYKKVGKYNYTVDEQDGNTQGVTYATNTFNVQVVVTWNENHTALQRQIAFTSVDNDKKVDNIINIYDLGSLDVKKTVTGNLGDREKDFTVEVTFTKESSKEVKSDITYVDGTKTKTITAAEINATGSVTKQITVAHGETVSFTNIPYGISYTVKELDVYATEQDNPNSENGYDAAKYNVNAKDDETTEDDEIITTAKVAADGVTATADTTGDKNVETLIVKDTVDIINNKGTNVNTGISLDNMPYIMVLALVALGLVGFVSKKRSMEF